MKIKIEEVREKELNIRLEQHDNEVDVVCDGYIIAEITGRGIRRTRYAAGCGLPADPNYRDRRVALYDE